MHQQEVQWRCSCEEGQIGHLEFVHFLRFCFIIFFCGSKRFSTEREEPKIHWVFVGPGRDSESHVVTHITDILHSWIRILSENNQNEGARSVESFREPKAKKTTESEKSNRWDWWPKIVLGIPKICKTRIVFPRSFARRRDLTENKLLPNFDNVRFPNHSNWEIIN